MIKHLTLAMKDASADPRHATDLLAARRRARLQDSARASTGTGLVPFGPFPPIRPAPGEENNKPRVGDQAVTSEDDCPFHGEPKDGTNA